MPSVRFFLAVLATFAAGCARDPERGSAPPIAAGDSWARVEALRERFQVAAPPVEDGSQGPRSAPRPAIGDDVATSFEATPGLGLRAVVPQEARRGGARPASVALPGLANGLVRLEDDTTHLAITFALEGASEAPIAISGGIAVYPGALGGADVVHRPHTEGTEDFVVFEEQPAREELRYTVDVSRVPGLRLVSNTLEFLDEEGAPRLRIAPPSVVDASGVLHAATLGVEGCTFDTNPVAPWGRAITRPGAPRCVVRVAWGGVEYPVLVDPAWTTTGSLATARYQHTATLLGSGKVLIAGGYAGSNSLTSAELYDPAGLGTFAATGSLATARSSHTATLLGSGKVLIAGGLNSGACLASAELYDPTGAGTFAATGSLAAARRLHTATLLGSGKVLITGGDNISSYLASAELYDPAGAGTFAATGSMTAQRTWHAATLLGSGKVLITGGYNTGTYLTSAELYNPAGGGTFTATGSMAAQRAFHTATLLGSGKVLVAGGSYISISASLASAEIYDPAGAGTFTATGSMAAARGSHTATLLGSGKVLVAGGYAGASTYLTSAELYDPPARGLLRWTARWRGSAATTPRRCSAPARSSSRAAMTTSARSWRARSSSISCRRRQGRRASSEAIAPPASAPTACAATSRAAAPARPAPPRRRAPAPTASAVPSSSTPILTTSAPIRARCPVAPRARATARAPVRSTPPERPAEPHARAPRRSRRSATAAAPA